MEKCKSFIGVVDFHAHVHFYFYSQSQQDMWNLGTFLETYFELPSMYFDEYDTTYITIKLYIYGMGWQINVN